MKAFIYALIITAGLALPQTAHAEIPRVLRYQGTLADSQGTPLEGVYNLTFRIYTSNIDPVGGELYSESLATTCTNGVFSVILGETGTPPFGALDFSQPYWLGIEVESEGEELSPRHRITSTAYAVRSEVAELALSAQTSDTVTLQGDGSGLDADTVDGSHAADLLNRTNHTGIAPAASITQGAGSGLDADTVDGQEASAFLNRANHTGTQVPSTISPQGYGSGLDADKLQGEPGTEYMLKKNFHVGSGVLQEGGRIEIPASFTNALCHWIVTPVGINYGIGNGPGHPPVKYEIVVDGNRYITTARDGAGNPISVQYLVICYRP